MRRAFAFFIAFVLFMSSVALADGTFSMAGCDNANIGHDWTTNLFFSRMEEITGVQFVFQQYDDEADWQKKKTEMFRSGNLPDVFFKADLTVSETIAYYEAGQLIDLRPYLEEYAPNLYKLLQENPEWEKAITLPDGAIVALPTFNTLQNNNVMWINKTWLDNLSLEIPTTAEELTEVLIAFRDRDANKNGSTSDEIPLSVIGMWDLRYLGHAFGLVSNDYYLYMEDDGTIATTLTADANRAFLEWLHYLWSEGLMHKDTFFNTDSVRMITDESAAINLGVFLAPTPLSLVPSTASGQYVALDPLVYEGEQIYRNTLGSVVRGTFAITSACEDPATLVKWVDYLYTEEGSRMAQAGLENVEYLFNSDGTWDYIAAIEEVSSTILPTATISDGGDMPGYFAREFQLNFAHTETHRILNMIDKFDQYTVEPMPLVILTDEEQAAIDAVHMNIALYAEDHMAYFVTGDIPLNDDTWADFCQTVTDKGIGTLISLWTEAVK